MYYHVPEGWSGRTAKQNRADKKELVQNGEAHGLLLYNAGDPIGWCQYGPPKELPLIDRKKSYHNAKALMNRKKKSYRTAKHFWRLTCFFVDKRYRNKGVARLLLDAALIFMKEHGVKMVEAYPIDTSRGKYRSDFLWPGAVKLFTSAGFNVVAKFGKKTRIVQKKL